MALTGQQLLDYACMQFENGAYDAALEAFILAYTKEYEQEWVLENIYNCYMAGNEAEFQKNYELWNTGEKPAYENLTLDFIPYREGEYYIYDKEIQSFRGIFSMNIVNSAERQEDLRPMEFSALALAMYWDWSNLPEILVEAGSHKIYAVCQDINRCASFFKIPELTEYAENIMLFSSMEEFWQFFHEHTSVYLPKICTGTEDGKKTLLEIINKEHEYRLTPEGRNTDNVLLTIGIPTYNRGNLLLERVKKLLQMPYDAEIEIAVSKNGMELYQEEYRQVSGISDARLVYFDHKRTLNPTANWRYVVEMSHGKYVLFVSDEDDVVLGALEHYFKLLAEYPQMNLVRSKTMMQCSYIKKRSLGKKGMDAFANMFLAQNYLSGLIVRRKDFVQEDFARLDRFSDNAFYKSYPHEWWCAVLSRRGDSLVEPVILIEEKDGVSQEEEDITIKGYSTYKARLQQFQGMIDFLHWFMDNNAEGAATGFDLAIRKIYHLFLMARQLRYDCEFFEEWVDRFYTLALDAVDGFDFEDEQKSGLLQLLKDKYASMLETHEKLKEKEEVYPDTWVKQAMQLCVNASQGENKLIREEFKELTKKFLSFQPQDKQTVFELMEKNLQNNTIITYVYSCIVHYTGLQEFEQAVMNHILSCYYDVLSGCMVEYQVIYNIKGCYTEKRSLHRRNAEKLRQTLGQEWTYIPAGSRNPNRVVIVTEQILALLHAPTTVIYNLAYTFKKYMGYEILIFECPSDYQISPEVWYGARYATSREDIQGMRYDIGYRDEIFTAYHIHMDSPDWIGEYRMMMDTIREWNPAFVLGVGIVNPVLDLVNDFTTVASMAMSINCPVSDSEILFRLTRQEEKREQEYAAALNQNQSQIFMESTLPVIAEGQAGEKYNREELGLPQDKFVIAIVGNRLDMEIGDKFSELMKSILTENPDCVFAVIGTVTELREYFEQTEYQERFFYLGYCPDLLGIYSVMDLYLNPERTGGGWSSAMALMAGVPVVTLPNCDVAYNVGEKFVVSGYPEMKAAVNRYMTDSDYMKEMKQYATDCGAEHTEEKMIKYVQSMVDGINAILER